MSNDESCITDNAAYRPSTFGTDFKTSNDLEDYSAATPSHVDMIKIRRDQLSKAKHERVASNTPALFGPSSRRTEDFRDEHELNMDTEALES